MVSTIQLSAIDIVVISIYIAVLLSLGLGVSFFKKDQASDLFLAGRSLKWPHIGLSILGTNITPSMLLASCGIAFTSGIVAANFEWLAWIFLLMMAMLFLPRYMNAKVSTMPEFIEKRFNNACKTFLSYYIMITTPVLWLGMTLYPAGLLMSQITGWSLLGSVAFLTAIATSFTVAGGLKAVVVTDSFQTILMIGASTILTISGILRIGGINTLVDSVPAQFWQLFRPLDDPIFPWPAIVLGYPVLGIWFWCTDQTILQRVLGAKNLKQGQLGVILAGYLKVLTPFIFFMPGILCYVLYPNLESPDQAYLTMVVNLMPPGLVGLIIAILMAALISTLDSVLNSISTIFTLDIYKDKIDPNATRSRLVWIGRSVTIFVAVIGVLIALGMGYVGKDLFNLFQGIIAFFAPPISTVFFVGVLWKRATARAALLILYWGCPISLGFGICHFLDWPWVGFWPHYLLLSFYLFAGMSLFMIGLSLLRLGASDIDDVQGEYSLSESRAANRWIVVPGTALAIIMILLYLVFNG